MQHAVAVAGFDLVRIGVLGQVHGALEMAGEALVGIDREGAVVARFGARAFTADRQQALDELDIQLCRIQAGGEGIDLDAGRRTADIDGREGTAGQGTDAAGPAEIGEVVLQLALQSFELGEQAARDVK